MAHGKNYINSVKDKDPLKAYSIEEGVASIVASSYAKFDESVDIAVKLGVDPRHADQMVRSTLVLPNGTGRTERVLVFAKGDKVQEALDAGADYAGGDDLVEKIQGGWLDFEKCIATPDMMGVVGKIGRVLGPRSLMPNAKLGTVTFDITRVVGEVKSGKVDFRVDKAGIVHAMLGKVSFGDVKIRENLVAFIEKLIQLKPSSAKGIYLKSVTLSTTMGPGHKLDTVELKSLVK